MDSLDFNIAGYLKFLSQRKIMSSHCIDCDRNYLPPRPICQHCQSRNMEWVELSGQGVLVAFSSIKVVPAAMASRGYSRERPYVSGFVALEEGPTIPGRIEGTDESVRVGMPVKADFLEESRGDKQQMTLVFRGNG